MRRRLASSPPRRASPRESASKAPKRICCDPAWMRAGTSATGAISSKRNMRARFAAPSSTSKPRSRSIRTTRRRSSVWPKPTHFWLNIGTLRPRTRSPRQSSRSCGRSNWTPHRPSHTRFCRTSCSTATGTGKARSASAISRSGSIQTPFPLGPTPRGITSARANAKKRCSTYSARCSSNHLRRRSKSCSAASCCIPATSSARSRTSRISSKPVPSSPSRGGIAHRHSSWQTGPPKRWSIYCCCPSTAPKTFRYGCRCSDARTRTAAIRRARRRSMLRCGRWPGANTWCIGTSRWSRSVSDCTTKRSTISKRRSNSASRRCCFLRTFPFFEPISRQRRFKALLRALEP